MTQKGNLLDRFRAVKYSSNQFYRLFKTLGFKGSVDLYELLTSSASRVVNRWFESELIKATLVTDGLIGAMLGPYDVGTGYVLLHHVMGGLDGRASEFYF